MTAAVDTQIKIRPINLLVASLAASVPTSLFMSGVASLSLASEFRLGAAILTATVGASFLLFLIGASLVIAVAVWRREVPRSWCYLLGSVVIFLLPLTVVAIVINGAPMVFPEQARTYSAVEVPVEACLLFGVIGQPYGWFAGWIVKRLLFPAVAYRDSGRFTRLWSGVRRGRLLLSLSLLPLLPGAATVYGMLIYMSDSKDGWSAGEFVFFTIWVLVTALPLAILGGMTFLYATSKNRDRVSLATCATLGGAVSLALPFACNLVALAIGAVTPFEVAATEPSPLQYFTANIAIALLGGVVITPLGLPSGWLLWQFGIAPAPRLTLTNEIASTFD